MNYVIPAKGFGRQVDLHKLWIFGLKSRMTNISINERLGKRTKEVRIVRCEKTGWLIKQCHFQNLRNVRFDLNEIRCNGEEKNCGVKINMLQTWRRWKHLKINITREYKRMWLISRLQLSRRWRNNRERRKSCNQQGTGGS